MAYEVTPGNVKFPIDRRRDDDEDVLAGQICVERAQQVGIKLTLMRWTDPRSATLSMTRRPQLGHLLWGWDSGAPDPDYLMSIELTSQLAATPSLLLHEQYDTW